MIVENEGELRKTHKSHHNFLPSTFPCYSHVLMCLFLILPRLYIGLFYGSVLVPGLSIAL